MDPDNTNITSGYCFRLGGGVMAGSLQNKLWFLDHW